MDKNKKYYTLGEVFDLVDDIEELTEYLNGWPNAVVGEKEKRLFLKKYVDMFLNR